jgi:monoamine oxidase
MERLGVAAVDSTGTSWILRDGRLRPRGNVFAEIRRAMASACALATKDGSFQTLLTQMRRHGLSPAARTFARMLVAGYDAADPARASARAISEEWLSESAVGALRFRPLGGYGALMAALAATLDGSQVRLRLRTIVRAVRWGRGAVTVEGTRLGMPFRASARRAVITLPLGVLQLPSRSAGAVRFVPALGRKRDALRGLASGPVVKLALRFRSAFWEELDAARWRDAAFFHAPHAAFPTFWTALPVRTPLLMAWAGGPKAARLSRAARPEIVRRAVTSIKSLFGGRPDVAAQLEAASFHDWQRDPFARGAYSYVAVGGEGALAALAAPLDDTLFFAGEATDPGGEAGTVAGALQSGVRAAREAMRGG